MKEKLSRFLLKYRITPHSSTGVAPAELLMARSLRSRLDLLNQTCQQQCKTINLNRNYLMTEANLIEHSVRVRKFMSKILPQPNRN